MVGRGAAHRWPSRRGGRMWLRDTRARPCLAAGVERVGPEVPGSCCPRDQDSCRPSGLDELV
ncbi:hypothetical protein E2C01_035789 [Portunus trituberculatus]|uniref:Uncharacterized protein n=1 Tax=Portunus trituberculatus TaxID=210409 RepID=A0A5B7F9A3_PORTR|nr:hypothetical protein [Portunus trituberculatus]